MGRWAAYANDGHGGQPAAPVSPVQQLRDLHPQGSIAGEGLARRPGAGTARLSLSARHPAQDRPYLGPP